MNPHEILGVNSTANIAEIKTKYRILAKRHNISHNMANKSSSMINQQTSIMKKINSAYKTLLDEITMLDKFKDMAAKLNQEKLRKKAEKFKRTKLAHEKRVWRELIRIRDALRLEEKFYKEFISAYPDWETPDKIWGILRRYYKKLGYEILTDIDNWLLYCKKNSETILVAYSFHAKRDSHDIVTHAVDEKIPTVFYYGYNIAKPKKFKHLGKPAGILYQPTFYELWRNLITLDKFL